jgi:hypothetical protein
VLTAEDPQDGGHHQVAEDEPDHGREHHRDDDLDQHAMPEHGRPCGERRAAHATEQGM